MWDAQAADLLPYFRVLRYDTRGHGASSAPAGDYAIADLARDVLALADSCGVTQFAFCGLSLGGMIGQWLAAHAPGACDAPRSRQHHGEAVRSAADGSAAAGGARRRDGRGRSSCDGPVLLGLGARLAVTAGGERAADAARRRARLATLDAVPRSATWITHRSWRRFTLPTLVISGDLDVGMPWDRPCRDPDARHSRRPRRAPAGRAHLEPREAAFLQRRRPRFSRALDDGVARRWHGRCGAPCSAATMSIAPSPGRPTSRATSRMLITSLRLGQHLDAAGPRSPHPPPAGPDSDGRARTLGGVPPARPHRPRARARALRSRRRSCCSSRSMQECPPPTPRSISPLRSLDEKPRLTFQRSRRFAANPWCTIACVS